MDWVNDVEAQRAAAGETVRADLAELRQEMQAGLARVREEMQAGFARADTTLAGSHEEMRVGFAELREEMRQQEVRFERRFGDLIKWSFAFWVGAVGAIALLAEALR